MKILVIGSGGREHALVKAVNRSSQVAQVFAAPGNPGMASEATCIPIKVTELEKLRDFAIQEKIDLTIVGPEQPLTDGIVDLFQKSNLKIFGPNQRAAILEASKVFTKDFLRDYDIPTAKYAVCSSLEEARRCIKGDPETRWVVKVDGLAAGKGVFVTQNTEEALEAVRKIFQDKIFGEQEVVLEEFLDGEELSFMVLCDGWRAIPLASSQDHKRLRDGDEGPNTGGMGAYSPAPILTPELQAEVMETIINRTIYGMNDQNRSFVGVLYAGLMIVKGKPYVLEFNVRFGDPEAQVILPRLESDWVDLFEAAIDGKLNSTDPVWKNESAACVVLAAEGYPDSVKTGAVIEGLEKLSPEDLVYHAGTKLEGGKICVSGGRVLGVAALGSNLKNAVDQAYQTVQKIHFQGMQFRHDIAKRGLEKQ